MPNVDKEAAKHINLKSVTPPKLTPQDTLLMQLPLFNTANAALYFIYNLSTLLAERRIVTDFV